MQFVARPRPLHSQQPHLGVKLLDGPLDVQQHVQPLVYAEVREREALLRPRPTSAQRSRARSSDSTHAAKDHALNSAGTRQ
eukprot:262452-Rhodomonas_salina.2